MKVGIQCPLITDQILLLWINQMIKSLISGVLYFSKIESLQDSKELYKTGQTCTLSHGWHTAESSLIITSKWLWNKSISDKTVQELHGRKLLRDLNGCRIWSCFHKMQLLCILLAANRVHTVNFQAFLPSDEFSICLVTIFVFVFFNICICVVR